LTRIGPNELCPCGSGKKFKKCCGDPRETDRYTRDDRTTAFYKLNQYIDAFAADELPPERAELFDDVEQLWFAFDYRGADGASVVERFLASAQLLAGERAFLDAARRSSMRIYEVTDASPGVSLTLRDAIESGSLRVNERAASRTVGRGNYLAARVVPRGPSGGPEIEAGLLHIAPLVKEPLLARIGRERASYLAGHHGGDLTVFYKRLPPMFHEVWVGTMLY
jgi:hypothetical protein